MNRAHARQVLIVTSLAVAAVMPRYHSLINAQQLQSASYTLAQADAGKRVYAQHCVTCQGNADDPWLNRRVPATRCAARTAAALTIQVAPLQRDDLAGSQTRFTSKQHNQMFL
jgi:hypothetical protein